MKAIISSLLAAAFVLAASPSMAANAKHLAQLKKTKNCPFCDLSDANLKGMFLAGANLRGANLRGADLRGGCPSGPAGCSPTRATRHRPTLSA